jgi:hypothetical protein
LTVVWVRGDACSDAVVMNCRQERGARENGFRGLDWAEKIEASPG